MTTTLDNSPLPPSPPPPPLTKPTRHWGLGDVVVGIVLFFVANVAYGVIALAVWLIPQAASDPALLERSLDVTDIPAGLMLAATAAASVTAFVGIPLLATRRKGARSLRADFGLSITWRDVRTGLFYGALALGGSNLIGLAMRYVVGTEAPSNTGVLSGVSGWPTMLLAVAVVGVIVPIAEELFFRGLALRALLRRVSTRWAVVISSVLFGAMHVFGATSVSGYVLIPLITGVFGAMFAVATVRTGRLGAAIVAHMTVNTTVVVSSLLIGGM